MADWSRYAGSQFKGDRARWLQLCEQYRKLFVVKEALRLATEKMEYFKNNPKPENIPMVKDAVAYVWNAFTMYLETIAVLKEWNQYYYPKLLVKFQTIWNEMKAKIEELVRKATGQNNQGLNGFGAVPGILIVMGVGAALGGVMALVIYVLDKTKKEKASQAIAQEMDDAQWMMTNWMGIPMSDVTLYTNFVAEHPDDPELVKTYADGIFSKYSQYTTPQVQSNVTAITTAATEAYNSPVTATEFLDAGRQVVSGVIQDAGDIVKPALIIIAGVSLLNLLGGIGKLGGGR